MTSSKDREYTVDVSGIPAQQRSLARQDIGRLVDAVAVVAKARGKQFLLQRICVTDRFEDEVNRLLQERSGPTGYAAVRSHVRAIGKTLWIRSQHGDLKFAVVIDANQMGSWRFNNARCLTTVLHELSHILCEERHLQRLGEEEYTAFADTRERLLDGWASMLLDEFDVDRLVDALLRGLATTSEGRPWSLQELEEAQGADWIQGLRAGLHQMPDFVDEKVWEFRTGRIGIDDLATVVVPNIRDVLVLLSHTASMYMGTERWPGIVKDIKETGGLAAPS